MPESTDNLVFLSYAHEDGDRILEVYSGLMKRRVNVWFDKVELKAQKLIATIERTLCHCKSYVFCLSNAALKKTSLKNQGFLDKELHTAWNLAKEYDANDFQFVVARLEECERGDLRIRNRSQIDLFPDIQKGLDELAVILGGISFSDTTVIDERAEEEKATDSMMGKGATSYFFGEYERTLSINEDIISIKPKDHEAWYNKGVVLSNLARPDEALDACNKAIQIKPNMAEAWYNKGYFLDVFGLHEKALKAFDKAIKIKPNFQEAWSKKGVALSNLGRHAEALEACHKAIQIRQNLAEAQYNKGYFLDVFGRRKLAQKAFNKSIKNRPYFYKAMFDKNVLLLNLGKASKSFTKTTEIRSRRISLKKM